MATVPLLPLLLHVQQLELLLSDLMLVQLLRLEHAIHLRAEIGFERLELLLQSPLEDPRSLAHLRLPITLRRRLLLPLLLPLLLVTSQYYYYNYYYH